MRLRVALFLLSCGVSSGQESVEIGLPPQVNSGSFFIRYVLAGDTLGGWVQPQAGVSSYMIGTMRGTRPATELKAVLYAPGCAIKTLDVRLFAGQKSEQVAFVCQPLGSVPITGRVVLPDRFEGRAVKVEARYIVRWAQAFLGIDDSLVLAIPTGTSDITADGSFHLTVPDFSRDPESAAGYPASEIQIWAKDKADGSLVAELVPNGLPQIKTRMGGLKIQGQYPAGMVLSACVGTSRHDASGFAIRGTGDCEH